MSQDGDPQAAGMGINSVNGKNQVTNWCYDVAGNVIDPTQPCPATPPASYPNIYDAENRLASATVGGATTVFDYDAAGQRVKKSGATNTLYWYGPGGEVLEETDLNGTLQNEYVFFGGKRVARYSATNGYSFYFSDHLGSADVVTDALGNIKEESDYYPFGGERVVTDLGIGNNYKFTGKERDPETGCDYFGARYYCNPIGRFITPDWAAAPTEVPYANFGNPQSLNLYSYVKNNPTTFGDPDGHCDWCQKLKNLWNDGYWQTDEQVSKTLAARKPLTPNEQYWLEQENVAVTLIMLGSVNDPEAEAAVPLVQETTSVTETALAETAPQGAAATPKEIPESIPAGPSARPNAAQQRGINEMGDARGCSTCPARTPGTKSGNWVGDHQPSTAVNPPGNPQVYRPQCLTCSLRQGGQVRAAQAKAAAAARRAAAAAAAAKKQQETTN